MRKFSSILFLVVAVLGSVQADTLIYRFTGSYQTLGDGADRRVSATGYLLYDPAGEVRIIEAMSVGGERVIAIRQLTNVISYRASGPSGKAYTALSRINPSAGPVQSPDLVGYGPLALVNAQPNRTVTAPRTLKGAVEAVSLAANGREVSLVDGTWRATFLQKETLAANVKGQSMDAIMAEYRSGFLAKQYGEAVRDAGLFPAGPAATNFFNYQVTNFFVTDLAVTNFSVTDLFVTNFFVTNLTVVVTNQSSTNTPNSISGSPLWEELRDTNCFFLFMGDSLTHGYQGYAQATPFFTNRYAVWTNIANNGQGLAAARDRYTNEIQPMLGQLQPGMRKYAFIWVGANDTAAWIDDPTNYFRQYVDLCRMVRSNGFKVAAFTLHNMGTNVHSAYTDARRLLANDLLRRGDGEDFADSGYDVLIDMARLLNNPYDQRVYSTDQVHLAPAGSQMVAGYVSQRMLQGSKHDSGQTPFELSGGAFVLRSPLVLSNTIVGLTNDAPASPTWKAWTDWRTPDGQVFKIPLYQ